MKLVNQHNGHYRKVTFVGALIGSFFLGPFYLLCKGVWTWALGTLAINLTLAALHPPFLLISWPICAVFAPAMVENFYKQRGFSLEAV